jgi:hypothetical protein
MAFRIFWPDLSHESEWSKVLISAKQVNGPDYWPTLRRVVAHDLETLPLNRFRHWASAHNIPLITQYRTSRFIGNAFHAAYDDARWHDALLENWIGVIDGQQQYLRVADDFDTSMQRVQDLSHLVTTNFAPEIFKKYRSVVEIGGGYGDMCSVIHSLGFEGKYTIFDFPEIQGIQKYYLERQDIHANFVTKPEELEPADLVIATWSLSEIPFDLRSRIVDSIYDSQDWMILFQDRIFGSIQNNKQWFSEKFAERRPQYILHNKTEYDGENNYMVIRS